MTKYVHFDKTHLYNRKNLKPKKFANSKWHNKDHKLFVDAIDIPDTRKPTFEWNNISSQSFKTNPNSGESSGLSTFLNIPDLLSDKEHDEDDDGTSEDDESYLQLNKADRESGIQLSADAPLKRFR